MRDLSSIQPQHLDILKEVGNIGAGNAATALSQMLSKTIDMKVPAVKVVPFHEISDSVGGEETVVAAVFLRIEGDAPGNMFFMLPLHEANELIRQLIGDPQLDLNEEPMNEMGASALNELGNILAGSYLSALSDFTKLNLQPTPPASAVDMSMALISAGLVELSQAGDYAIVIDTEINEKDKDNSTQSKGHFFLLPDPDSLDKMFLALEVCVDE
ncbi:CheY-P-specific phosphatase CheC [Salipaludibacillus keqinensis]|uniref:CheY-P-specific phosphatase CheC n=1 Tax=Salipaludibacillus keqinensis TaxID=2045207 RepID=A0A323TGV3_9BACI|nr:chemotaxis protein CheC [Salipaludibacillus keqinensis]PYZ93124.1 CheY-P-specific phosphatase CheC [Salipaludibacillus keqinensis]